MIIERCYTQQPFVKLISILSLSTVFQFAACAQSTPQGETKKTVESVAPSAAHLGQSATNQVAATTVSTAEPSASRFVANERAGAEKAQSEALIVNTETQVKPPAPQIQPATLTGAAHANLPKPTLPEAAFAQPEAKSPHAPRTFHASAYSIQGRTRSGVATRPGTIAADPRVLPLGTVVSVNAGKYSGVYTVHDTGGAIKGNRLDVWLPSTKEARYFGRRSVKLVVLKYPGQNAKPAK